MHSAAIVGGLQPTKAKEVRDAVVHVAQGQATEVCATIRVPIDHPTIDHRERLSGPRVKNRA
jgi:hypothetical protein